MKFIKTLFLLLVSVNVVHAQISVKAAVDHVIPDGVDSTGNITLSVSGGTAPYSYTWTPGSLYTKDITDQKKQAYVLKVKDSGSATASYTYNIGYKVKWSEHFGTVEKHDTLLNTGLVGWAQAVSKNTLLASTDGWFEYVLTDLNNYKKIGFLDSISNTKTTALDIDYGFYYVASENRLFKIVNGVESVILSNPGEGAVLRVERIGSVINFKVNGTLMHSVTSAAAVAKNWKIKAHIANGTTSGSVVNVGCSFSNQFNLVFPGYGALKTVVTHASSSSANDGGIKVLPTLSGSYTYTWQPGSVASSSITAKPAGTYSLVIEDSLHNKSTNVLTIGNKVKWGRFYSTIQKRDSLIYTGPAGWAQATSKNILSGSVDGWFEYVLSGLDQSKQIGFLDSVSVTVGSAADIDYGFYYYSTVNALYRVVKGYPTLMCNPSEGTLLRVERVGSTINFRINGVLMYSVVNATDASKDWLIKALLSGGTSFVNVGCSFLAEKDYTRMLPTITHVSNTFANDGSIALTDALGSSNTYTWQPGSLTTSSITAKPLGTYSVTIKDSVFQYNRLSYNIGYKANWSNLNGTLSRNDTLKSTGAYTLGRGVSDNVLSGGTNGWFEYVLKSATQTKYIGFLDSISVTNAQDVNDIDYGFYLASDGSAYAIISGSYYPVLPPNMSVGTILRVERIGSTINFKVNGTIIYGVVNASAVLKNWRIKGMVGNTASLVNVGCSFRAHYPLIVTPSVTNYANESSKGAINLNITGGAPPYHIAWNGNKLPSSTAAYHQVINSMAGLEIDSLKFKHAFDSISRRTSLADLGPGSYSVTVYDQENDSMALSILVPGITNSGPYAYGVSSATCSIASKTVSAVSYHYGTGLCITQQGSYAAGTHFVVQPTVIDLNEKNQINFGVPSTTAIVAVGLQAIKDEINGGMDDLSEKTMFHFKGDATYEIVFNNAAIKTGTLAANDRFSIRTNPLEGEISYYRNEILLLRTSAGPIKESTNGLIPKIVFGNAGSGLTGMQVIPFDFTPRITGLVADVSCSNLCGGSVTASGYYPLANAADHYEIYDASNVLKDSIHVSTVNSANFQNLCAGIYTIKYYFRLTVLTPAWLPQPGLQPLEAPLTQTFEIAYKPAWANMAHVQVNTSDFSLVKDNTGTQAVYDAGASSENRLSANTSGWLEWSAPQARGANVIGLSHADVGFLPTTTDYAVLMWRYSIGSGDARVYAMFNNGVYSGLGTFADNDKFRLETGSGTNLLFKINGTTVGQFTNFQPNQTYVADATLNIITGDINRPRLSFGCVGLEQYALPDKKLDGGYYTAFNQVVLFKYKEEYADKDNKLTFNIYNKKNEVVMTNLSMPSGISPNVAAGDNTYKLNIGNPAYWLSGMTMPGNEFYILEVINEKNEKWYLRFKKQ